MNELAIREETGVTLEDDPVQYMALALNRAKGWLDEARSIEDVRETRALAIGYESVIREKELAFDAQLSATEIVRRCERRIASLIRKGQDAGEIRKRGESKVHQRADNTLVKSPYDYVSQHELQGGGNQVGYYDLNDNVSDEDFERGIIEAREERNLSRANVVRRIKRIEPPQPDRSEWHRKKPHIDSNRILRSLSEELDALTAGLELMSADGIDPDVRTQCLPVAKEAIRTIQSHLRRVQ